MRIKALSKAKFKEWLQDKHPRTVVGHRGDGCSCPIARFLNHTTDKKWFVGDAFIAMCGQWGVPLDGPSYLVPRWGKSFIDLVDEETIPYHDTISAKKALRLLAAA